MKKFVFIGQVYLLLIGVFFILMSFDVFSMEDTFLRLVLGFLINSSPGIVIILLTLFLRKRLKILGYLIIAMASFLVILFKIYSDPFEQWMLILTLIAPLYFIGILFASQKNQIE